MDKKLLYQVPAARIAPLSVEPFLLTGGVPDYDPIDGFEWGDDNNNG